MRKRGGVKKQEWKGHWQVDTPEQLLENKPRDSGALQDVEEALPPMKAED